MIKVISKLMSYKKKLFPFALGAIVILIPIIFLLLKTPSSVSAAWYSSNWGYRKKMVIDHTKVSGSADLSSFPILVSVTDSDLKSLAQSDGDDIMFTSSDGTTKLDHEIEKYTSSTGQLVAWVRIPTLTYATDIEIYLYYGNPSATSQQNKTGVWDTNYVGVWHLSETSGHHLNSTSVSSLDSATEVVTAQGSARGIADGADSFTPSTNKVNISNNDNLDVLTTISVEIWMNQTQTPDQLGHDVNVLAKRHSATPWNSYGIGCDQNGQSSCAFAVNDENKVQRRCGGITPTVAGRWYYLAGTRAAGDNVKFYQDAVYQDTCWGSAISGAIFNSDSDLGLSNDDGNYPFSGILDEVRISNNVRTADWITTTYNTISSPSAFFKSTSVAQKGPVTSVLYWAFNEETGSSTYDSSGMGNTGTMGTGSSAPAWELDIIPYGNGGNGSSSLKFDGGGDYVSKSYSNDTELDVGTAGFSVSGWFHHSSTITGTDTILSRYSSGGYKVYMNSSGYVCFGIDSDATWSPSHTACSSVSYADSKWHHFEAVKTGTASITLYIDGLQAQQTSLTDTSSLSGSSPTLYVGVDSNGSSNPWDGYIDDIKIFDASHTSDQVKSNYNAYGAVQGASASFGSNDQTTSLSQGLVGYWKMDEASGTTTTDSSGNANTGNLGTGDSAPSRGSGKFGNGLTFDGTNDYVSLASAVNFSTATNWTVSGWFKRTGGSSSIQSLVSNDYNNNTFGLNLNPGGNDTLTWESGAAGWGRVTGPVLPTSWTYVTAVFSGVSGNWSVSWYLNGIFQSTTASDVAFSTPQIRYFGGWGAGGGAVINMDDLRIYNRALSTTEVQQLYNFAPGPVAYYKLDEGSGGTANDSSGNGYNGTWAGTGSPHYVSGKYGKAGNFDGAADWVYNNTIGNSLNLISATPPSLTEEGWFFVKNSENLLSLVCNGSGATCAGANNPNNNSRVRLGQSGGKLFFQLNSSSGVVLSSANTPLNTWVHVAGVYDSAANLMKLYVNGVYQNSATPANTDLSGLTMRLGIGNAQNYYKGLIDDVRIYNYARTPEQVLQDMGGGHPAQDNKSMLAYYKFDEGYGSTAKNSGIGSPDLTFGATTQAPSWSNSGKLGKALIFNSASSQYLYTANVALMAASAATYNSVSWGGWFNPTTDAITRTLVHKGNEFKLTTGADSKANCAIYSTSWQTAAISANALPLNSWSYVLCTYDGANIKVYVNGKQSGSSVAQTGLVTSVNSTPLNVGREPSTNYYNGLIDEVKIYGYALTSDDVLLDYNNNSGGSTVMGALSDNSTYQKQAANQEYCVPGDATSCAGPMGEWKMDEGRDNTCSGGANDACDSSGNGYDLAWYGTGSHWAFGKVGKAGLFSDVTSDRLRIAGSTSLSLTGDLTIESWFKSTAAPANIQFLVNKGTTSGNLEYTIRLDNADNELYFIVWNTANGYYLSTTSINTIAADNTWHHVGGTVSGNTMTLYLDGIIQVQTSSTSGTRNGAHSDDFTISSRASSGYWNGYIDHVRIFNYARTPAQISWDYNRGDPVAWYKFDECSGTLAHSTNTAYDSTLNATIGIGLTAPNTSVGTCTSGTNSEAWNNGAAGKFNASLDLDGQDDKVTVADTNNIRFDNAAQDFSLFAWVKRGTTGVLQYVLSKEDADNDGWRLMINANDTVTCSEDATDVTSTVTIADTNWHHVGCTIPRAGNGQVYIDGKTTGAAVAMGSDAMATTSNLFIGTRSYTPTSYFDGQIDDVRIFNYVLTGVQVGSIMNDSAAVRFAL